MTLTASPVPILAPNGSPTDRLLTASLFVAPLIYLTADTTYALKGWDNAAAGVLHVIGAIAFGLVILRIALWLPGGSSLTAALLVTAVAGSVGNAAYGFETIHQSLGDVPLVDQHGAAMLIKPIGLLFPLSLALLALGLHRLGHQWPGVMVLIAAIAWPVAHIANIAPLAVAVNVVLVISLGPIAWGRRSKRDASRSVPSPAEGRTTQGVSMRRLAVVLVSVLAMAMGGAPAHATPSSSIHIRPKTSPIYRYDGSPDGTGPGVSATTVRTVVRRCPAGDYRLEATLTQDGVDLSWATGALGAGEVSCDGTTHRTPLDMGFYGLSLHPGRATAHFALYQYECADGVCSPSDTPTIEATRTVRVSSPHHHHRSVAQR